MSLTSSVGAMLQELNWETHDSRRHAAGLVLFYEIHHHGLYIPLKLKCHPESSRTENSLAYHIPTGGSKNRNPRNPPKFTKSSVLNRSIVTETCLNQQG